MGWIVASCQKKQTQRPFHFQRLSYPMQINIYKNISDIIEFKNKIFFTFNRLTKPTEELKKKEPFSQTKRKKYHKSMHFDRRKIYYFYFFDAFEQSIWMEVIDS